MTFNSAEDVQAFFKDFKYPKNPKDYKRQFFHGVHRSQLSPEQLAEYEKEIQLRRMKKQPGISAQSSQVSTLPKTASISVSDYFFYVDYYSSYDYYNFEDAWEIWGDMIDWDSDYDDWNTNTAYMNDTYDVIECQEYLSFYTCCSEISDLVDSGSDYPDATTGLGSGSFINLSGPAGSPARLAKTADIPNNYVYPDLNPGFENWGSSYPSAWNISISSPYNVPSEWNNYYRSSDVTQSTTHRSGAYSAEIYLNRNNGRSLASAYFELNYSDQQTGEWSAGVYMHGNPQEVAVVFEVAFYDNSGSLILTESRRVQAVTSGFGVQSIEGINLNTVPRYVRFNIRQENGQNRNHLWFDDVWLKGPGGDVSLPVTLSYFNGTYYAEGPNHTFDSNWKTESETDNMEFRLYYKNAAGNFIRASDEIEPGLGSSAFGKTYAKVWNLNTSMRNYYNLLDVGDSFYMVLASVDYGGVIHFYEDKAVVVTKQEP